MNRSEENQTASLMAAHQAGDRAAFDQILAPYRDDLWGYLLNSVRSRQDAEDLFQETCLKALKNLNTLQQPERFRSWLFSIAMNSVRSFFRKPNRFLSQEVEEMERNLVQAPIVESRMEREEKLRALKRCILALPERDREVLLLDVMAELPQQEIAERLDLNLNTVKTIIRRAKIKLARMMTEVAHG